MSKILLDTETGITFNEKFPVLINCHSLFYLPVGLHSLAFTVRQAELEKFTHAGQFEMGPYTAQINHIACCFHWFAISLVNYLRLVGLIGIMSENNWRIESLAKQEVKNEVKRHCREYVKSVIPEISTWRNKVGAHLASTDPFSEDNIGTLAASMAHPITYSTPYYHANAMTYGLDEHKDEIPSWSLTEAYDHLTPRFWPHMSITPFPETQEQD
jgi:hypothetical protein